MSVRSRTRPACRSRWRAPPAVDCRIYRAPENLLDHRLVLHRLHQGGVSVEMSAMIGNRSSWLLASLVLAVPALPLPLPASAAAACRRDKPGQHNPDSRPAISHHVASCADLNTDGIAARAPPKVTRSVASARGTRPRHVSLSGLRPRFATNGATSPADASWSAGEAAFCPRCAGQPPAPIARTAAHIDRRISPARRQPERTQMTVQPEPMSRPPLCGARHSALCSTCRSRRSGRTSTRPMPTRCSWLTLRTRPGRQALGRKVGPDVGSGARRVRRRPPQ